MEKLLLMETQLTSVHSELRKTKKFYKVNFSNLKILKITFKKF